MNAADAPCRTDLVTPDIARCFNLAYRIADRKLSQAYRRTMMVLGRDEQDRLREAELSWVKYRDQDCLAERDLYGNGTGAWPAYWACLEAETRHRLADLTAGYGWRVEKFDK